MTNVHELHPKSTETSTELRTAVAGLLNEIEYVTSTLRLASFTAETDEDVDGRMLAGAIRLALMKLEDLVEPLDRALVSVPASEVR